MSIYPLDRKRRYTTPGGATISAFSDALWTANHCKYFSQNELRNLFGESLIPVVEMTEVTVEFDDEANIEGNLYIGWSKNQNLPLLQPGTTAHFTVTIRYPMGSELNSAKDDK